VGVFLCLCVSVCVHVFCGGGTKVYEAHKSLSLCGNYLILAKTVVFHLQSCNDSFSPQAVSHGIDITMGEFTLE